MLLKAWKGTGSIPRGVWSVFSLPMTALVWQTESGGTVLSTNWDEINKGKVDVKPPDGMEFKKYEKWPCRDLTHIPCLQTDNASSRCFTSAPRKWLCQITSCLFRKFQYIFFRLLQKKALSTSTGSGRHRFCKWFQNYRPSPLPTLAKEL